MRIDKEKAFALRKKGLSYKKICKKLGIPLSTISGWFKKEPWSIEIRDKLSKEASLANPDRHEAMNEANRKRFALLHENYRKEAISEFASLKDNPLFIAGIMLYWGEGDKNVNNSLIRLTNSDLGMIRSFYVFLVNSMNVPKDKIIMNLLLYPDLIDDVQKKLWSDVVGIPLAQFRKSVYIKGRHPTRRLAHGVGIIRVGGRKYKEKIMKWIELFMREFGGQLVA